ncbi:MAG: energy transducer TonB [Bacteroidetes bacterium]|nr:energy transducer TonB [Bacteroidota bacterium]MBU1718451.1 energy transducer TonB [Bacteroidota bacterium]
MKAKKEKINKRAATGTGLFLLVLLLILLIAKLSVPLPLPEEQGVVIDLGMAGGGGGGTTSANASNESSQSDSKATNENQNTDPQKVSKVATFDDAENPAMKTSQEEVKKENPEPNPLADFGNWKKNKSPNSNGTGNGTGDGNGNGTDKGSGDGNNGGNGTGDGPGDGPHYSLSGRGAKNLPKPDYNVDEEGKVVVEIWVDRDGKVTRAAPGAKGTTTTNSYLHNKAKDAAMKATFSSNPEAAEIQKGTITYYFILN